MKRSKGWLEQRMSGKKVKREEGKREKGREKEQVVIRETEVESLKKNREKEEHRVQRITDRTQVVESTLTSRILTQIE